MLLAQMNFFINFIIISILSVKSLLRLINVLLIKKKYGILKFYQYNHKKI